MRHLKTILEELEITYSKPLQPVVLHRQDSPMQLRHAQALRSSIPIRKPRSPDSAAPGNAGRFSNTTQRAFPPSTRGLSEGPDQFS